MLVSEFVPLKDCKLGWNLHFLRNLTNRLVDELSCWKNYFLLEFLLFWRQEFGLWSLDPLGSYLCASFYKFFIWHWKNPIFSLHVFFWKTKVPYKVKAFIWMAVLNRLNTNDLFQILSTNIVISPNVCVMYF